MIETNLFTCRGIFKSTEWCWRGHFSSYGTHMANGWAWEYAEQKICLFFGIKKESRSWCNPSSPRWILSPSDWDRFITSIWGRVSKRICSSETIWACMHSWTSPANQEFFLMSNTRDKWAVWVVAASFLRWPEVLPFSVQCSCTGMGIGITMS